MRIRKLRYNYIDKFLSSKEIILESFFFDKGKFIGKFVSTFMIVSYFPCCTSAFGTSMIFFLNPYK